jgi:hypothetical protein
MIVPKDLGYAAIAGVPVQNGREDQVAGSDVEKAARGGSRIARSIR